MNIKIIQGMLVRHNEVDLSRDSIWFIHGFGDSGLVYKEVFTSPLAATHNLFVLDMPGFGISPVNQGHPDIKSQAHLLSEIILQASGLSAGINIVAHSLGALIGTWVCQQLASKINFYINVEGNLTASDSYFSRKPLAFETGEAFFHSFEQEIFEKAKEEERYRRYYASLRFAQIEGMINWAKTSQPYIKHNLCGQEFSDLRCNKIYLWGDQDTPAETQQFIQDRKIPHKLYKGVGHWHMVENAATFYTDVAEFLQT